MGNEKREELIQILDDAIGLDKFFTQLGIEEVSRNGKNIYMVCPFHEGADNPTGFCWNTDKGFGYCFTHCHKSYSIFDIIMRMLGYDFIESVSYLSSIIGVEIEWNSSSNTNNSDNRTFLSQVKKTKSFAKLKKARQFDTSILKTFVPKLHTNLRKDGFDESIQEYFGLGYCTSGYLESRITIPIDDYEGNIITVSGRSVLSDEDIEFNKIKRYLIYYDTDKSKTLYNISRAIPYIELLGEVIVVEGFKSVWRLHQWGIRNVVAVMGSTISKEQVLLLLKLNAKVIVCGDRDEAGKILNQKVINNIKKFSDISYLDMYDLNVPEKSSIDNLTLQQYEYLYKHRKEVF